MHFLLLFFFILFAATLGGLDFFLRFPPRDVARFPQAKRGLEWATFRWNERPEMDGPALGLALCRRTAEAAVPGWVVVIQTSSILRRACPYACRRGGG